MDWLNIYGFWKGIDPVLKGKIYKTIILIFTIFVVRFLISHFLFTKLKAHKRRYYSQKITNSIATLLILLVMARIWLTGIDSIATILGLFSAGIAVALKDPILNITGWLFIVVKKPFELGHRIQIGNDMGDVIDIHLFQTSILEIGNWVESDQSTGRIIHIPNGKVFTESQTNYNQGFEYLWNEIKVLITFESNWKLAKEIIEKIMEKDEFKLSTTVQNEIKKSSKKYMIFYTNFDPIVYTSVKDCGVNFAIRYLCRPKDRRATTEVIWEDILREFAKHNDIDFAYPTQRFFNNKIESKIALETEQ